MTRLQQIRTPAKEESGKKLRAFTILTTLLVACIVFSSVLLLNGNNKLRLLDQYIREVPVIVRDREQELETRAHVFEEDILARGELGTRIYGEESALPIEERLDKVCSTVSARSVSLTDKNGALLNTTGPVIPADLFETRIRTLEARKPVFELYPASADDGRETEKQDGTAFIMVPVGGEAGRRLVFEFSCDPLLDIVNTIGNWPSVLERMLSGLEAEAFVLTGEGDIYSSPLKVSGSDEQEQLRQEAAGIFSMNGDPIGAGSKSTYKLVPFRGRLSLAILCPYPELDAQVLIALPLLEFISTGFYCALTLSAFIVFSLILFSLYVLMLSAKKHNTVDEETFIGNIDRETQPGRILLLLVVGVFSVMLLMLENNATLAYIGRTKRESLEYEVNWHEDQRKTIRSSYTDIYRTRTQALAALLTDHREYRTHTDLQALGDTLQAEYLMLFDETGREITSSNTYTGFSIDGPDANLSDKYRAVLLGYPSAVVGPEEDPYTKKQQMGAAILLTKENGEPDGFVLAVFDAGAMNSELKKESLEYTVSTFAVAKGYKAAVIDNETGVFLAHTDAKKKGLKAEDYLTAVPYGEDFEGFTEYEGTSMYVSGVSNEGKNLLFMVPNRQGDTLSLGTLLMIAALLLITGFLYCPKAARLCARAMNEAIKNQDLSEEDIKAGSEHPLAVFASGYALFFTVLAGIALLAAYTLIWPAFTFVYGGLWSRGVHLFSLWAALFFLSATLCASILVRTALQGAEKRTQLRARTMFKLADSSIAYATGILIAVGILYMFGVNTNALLASAGIVSIAVGMGSQSLVSDIVAGLFLAIEDSIHMGDVVMIDSWTGRVTDMGIRTIAITDENQNVKILNNSNISDVVNMSRKKTACLLELTLDRRVHMAELEEILRKAAEDASEEMPELCGSLKLEGIHSITRDGCTARLSFACAEAARTSTMKRLQTFLEQEIEKEMEKISGEPSRDPDIT